MTLTPGLGLTLLEARQTQPHLVINEAIANLDKVASGRLAVDMTGLTTNTLSNANCLYTIINPYGAPSAFNLIVNGNVKLYLLINDAAYACTFKSATGASIIVPAGQTQLIYFDGGNMHRITAQDSGWIDQSLSTGWTNTGGSWASFSYRLDGNTLKLRGQVGSTTGTTNRLIAVLPSGYRPSVDKQIVLMDSLNGSYRIEVLANGNVNYQGSVATVTCLSFDGVAL